MKRIAIISLLLCNFPSLSLLRGIAFAVNDLSYISLYLADFSTKI
jgi:hypothetical protein